MRFCCYCDQVILGEAETIPVDSASGGRPDQHMHLTGDPRCPPRRKGDQ